MSGLASGVLVVAVGLIAFVALASGVVAQLLVSHEACRPETKSRRVVGERETVRRQRRMEERRAIEVGGARDRTRQRLMMEALRTERLSADGGHRLDVIG